MLGVHALRTKNRRANGAKASARRATTRRRITKERRRNHLRRARMHRPNPNRPTNHPCPLPICRDLNRRPTTDSRAATAAVCSIPMSTTSRRAVRPAHSHSSRCSHNKCNVHSRSSRCNSLCNHSRSSSASPITTVRLAQGSRCNQGSTDSRIRARRKIKARCDSLGTRKAGCKVGLVQRTARFLAMETTVHRPIGSRRPRWVHCRRRRRCARLWRGIRHRWRDPTRTRGNTSAHCRVWRLNWLVISRLCRRRAALR